MAEANRGTHGQVLSRMEKLVQLRVARKVSRKEWGPQLAIDIRRIARSPLRVEVLRKRHFPAWVIDAVVRERLPQTVRTVA